jgi:hypothetical protein
MFTSRNGYFQSVGDAMVRPLKLSILAAAVHLQVRPRDRFSGLNQLLYVIQSAATIINESVSGGN